MKRQVIGKKYLQLAGACIVIMMTCGIGFRCFSLFMPEIIKEMSFSKASFSHVWTFIGLSSLCISLMSFKIIPKLGLKNSILIGSFCSAAAYMLFSVYNNIYGFYFSGFLFGIGLSMAGSTTLQLLVVNIFKEKQGTAIGILSASLGFIAIFMAPLIGKLLDSIGWRSTSFLCGLFMLFFYLLAIFLFMRDLPKDDNIKVCSVAETLKTTPALRHRSFYLIIAVVFLSSFANQSILSHNSVIITDKGFATAVAAMAISITSIGNMGNKLLAGWLSDHFSFKTAGWYTCILAVLSCVFLYWAPNAGIVYLGALFFGMFGAVNNMSGIIMLKHCFPDDNIVALQGVTRAATETGILLAPACAALAYGLFSTYSMLLPVCAICFLMVLICLQSVFKYDTR